ncbi:MAG: hypothetical protein HYU36_13075 [Planctomycetes bacterium]|nr:hypothetical protein [Planctomycetota bacterium]
MVQEDTKSSRLVVGIDEAGYGPVLGPLVVSATVFEVSDRPLPSDFWSELRSVPVCRPDGTEDSRGLVVGDSKKIYQCRDDLGRLEAGVLSFAAASLDGPMPDTLEAFLGRFASEHYQPPRPLPWYAGPGPTLPCGPPGLPRWTALEKALRDARLRFHGFLVRPVFEPEFNTQVRSIGNKAQLLFNVSAGLSRELLGRHRSCQECLFLYDKQGGRDFYGPMLLNAFPDSGFLIEKESRARSVYRLSSAGRTVCHCFEMKGDEHHLPVGLAAMCSKYVRELFLRRFNLFWGHHLPGLRPTAGYYADAQRFLAETEALRRSLEMDDAQLVRCR